MYEAPKVEVIEVEVEKGFAVSAPDYVDRPLNKGGETMRVKVRSV